MIAEYLDKETAKIDEITQKILTLIDKLGEYRSALITAAVTGKIDVREPDIKPHPPSPRVTLHMGGYCPTRSRHCPARLRLDVASSGYLRSLLMQFATRMTN